MFNIEFNEIRKNFLKNEIGKIKIFWMACLVNKWSTMMLTVIII